jgi:hypothetical protein
MGERQNMGESECDKRVRGSDHLMRVCVQISSLHIREQSQRYWSMKVHKGYPTVFLEPIPMRERYREERETERETERERQRARERQTETERQRERQRETEREREREKEGERDVFKPPALSQGSSASISSSFGV